LEKIELFHNSCQKDLEEVERDLEALAQDLMLGNNGPAESLLNILIHRLNCLVKECQVEVENAISELK